MSIASVPFDILVQILNESNVKTVELVCKCWRDASRQRTFLKGLFELDMYHIKRYPYLNFIDVCSKKGQYNWSCFFQMITAWKLLGQSKMFRFVFRLPLQTFNWKQDNPLKVVWKDAEAHSMIWLEYDNGRLIMSATEFIPLNSIIAAYCSLEEKRDVVASQICDDITEDSVMPLHLNSFEYYTEYFYNGELKAMKRWDCDKITVFVKEPGKQTPAEGDYGHIGVVYDRD